MVERRQRRRTLHLEYEFDRLLASKLELAYDILVPDRVRIIGSAKMTGASDEERSDLRSCVIGQTAGGEHDRQPDGGTGDICPRVTVRRTAGMGFRR
jgi:site-specific DNA recombinase